ncbi:SRPBCC family protein [Kribbella sp. DT2]|uniref:SRPBCC family protein n=1 Tax=Kribbella sp. DT2 TaxID=3393427 RepID=UPI003CE9EB58
MSDLIDQLNAVTRSLGSTTIPAGDARTVVLTRTYAADLEDVWDALTTADRLARWLLPVEGDLHLGGTYRLSDSTRGDILACEPPHLLRITWLYGEDVTPKNISEVEARLEPDGPHTRLTLTHAAVDAEDFWAQYGPGATGVGWDLALLALHQHLAGTPFNPTTWESTPEAQQAATHSSTTWGETAATTGTPSEQVTQWVEATTKFYTTD